MGVEKKRVKNDVPEVKARMIGESIRIPRGQIGELGTDLCFCY